ncbi:MAG: hypothetical protein LUC40_04480, partial [Oscillospiraceae bacterium]|nr:hypothetical protein [Oscillospiraceae bacterium]
HTQGAGPSEKTAPPRRWIRQTQQKRFSELNRSHIRCHWDIHLTGGGRFRRICGLFCGKSEENLEFWTK